jgi:hypothetical protein
MACEAIFTAKWIYIALESLACIVCFTVTLIPKFDQAHYRKARGMMYIILGLGSGGMFIMFEF